MDDTTRPTGRPRPAIPPGPGRAPQGASRGSGQRAERTGPPTARKSNAAAVRERSPTRRFLIGILYTLPLFLLAGAALAVGYVKLRHGPLALDILVSPIESGIEESLGDGRKARVGGAALALDGEGGLEIQLTDLEITEADGRRVASTPKAVVEIDSWSLARFSVVPERVDLIDPQINIFYARETGLALSFAAPADAEPGEGVPAEGAPPPPAARSDAVPAPPRSTALEVGRARIDLARWLADSAARARRGDDQTSALRKVGVRNAVVTLDYEGRLSRWHVQDAAVDLEHRRRRSKVSGSARLSGGGNPKPFTLAFGFEDSERTGHMDVTASVGELVPAALAKAIPDLSMLSALEMPLGARTKALISAEGDVRSADIELGLAANSIDLPGGTDAPTQFEKSRLRFVYDAESRSLTLEPSTLSSGESRITLSGHAAAVMGRGGRAQWRFDLQSGEGTLVTGEDGGRVPFAISAGGVAVPSESELRLEQASVKAGGAEITLGGEIAPGVSGPHARFEGKLSPMPVSTLKALWPAAVASTARQWVETRLTRGEVRSGTLMFTTGKPRGAEGAPGDRFSVAIELADLAALPAPGASPIEAPRALVRGEGDTLEITIPEASVTAAPQSVLHIKGIRFTAIDLGGPDPAGEIAFSASAPLSAALAIAARPPLSLYRETVLPVEGLDGKIDGQFKIAVPLGSGTPGAPVVTGSARVSDIRSKKKIGPLELQGGTINLSLNGQSMNTEGNLMLNGVLANLNWQRILDEAGAASAAQARPQPPLTITATLDNSDRTQLGLDVNHIVQGDLPVVITVGPAQSDATGLPAIHVRADLTPAEVSFRDLAWRKPAGRAAFLDFDVGQGTAHPIEMQRLKIAGDSIAIEGWAAINAENDLAEFYFEDFSLNVVSRLTPVEGKLGSDKVWRIKAKGSAYDARDFFNAIFRLAGSDEPRIRPLRPSAGMDIEAEIANVIGHNEVSLRGAKLKVSERAEKLVALAAQGTLDGGRPFLAQLKKSNAGKRILYAETTDGGQAFKLAGFYKSVIGGHLRLEVNLDGEGAAEKSGILWLEKFRVLGDPVVSEVIATASGSAAAKGGREVVREVYDFDALKVPFSAGHDQFVMGDSFVRGPIVGATISGKVDFKSARVNLGGTYIPLQGINSALCAVPLLGAIIVGPKCDGVVGITYAIQGPMAQPQVLVNPLSMFTPGILKEIMQMTNPNQKVQAREAPRATAAPAIGSSSSEPVRSGQGRGEPQTIDGWNSQQQVTPGGEGKSRKP